MHLSSPCPSSETGLFFVAVGRGTLLANGWASCCLGLPSHCNGVGVIGAHYGIWLYVGFGHLNSDVTGCTSYFSVAIVEGRV